MQSTKYSFPNFSTLATCFLRSYLVGAAFNTRGMQNVGLIFALEPGLRRIYPNPRDLLAARKRYLKHYNTHLFWTPLLLGIFLSIEDKVSRHVFPKTVLENLKDPTVYTLSAIGDSVFAGSLLVFWSLTTTIMALIGSQKLVIYWIIAWFAILNIFKIVTFILGYKEGLSFILRLKRWKLIDWGQRLKICNAVLLSVVLYLIWPGSTPSYAWGLAVAGLGLATWLVTHTALSREIVAILLLALYSVLPYLEHVTALLH